MKYDIITIFPEIFYAYLSESILKRALQKGLIEVKVHNLRDYTKDKNRTVDDYPYGGGAGMVMKPEPFFTAVETLYPDVTKRRVIMLSPAGKKFDQDIEIGRASCRERVCLRV
jgi:tRNA (guanine37-N1)-methyltransferase